MTRPDRPVKTTMPDTPIPPTTGSKGAVPFLTHIPLSGKDVSIQHPGNDPGSMTSPSPQGPVRPEAVPAKQTPWPDK